MIDRSERAPHGLCGALFVSGDSFVLTRNGTPVADIAPHSQKPTFVPFGDLIELLGDLPPEDPERFFADVDRAADPDPHRGPGEPER